MTSERLDDLWMRHLAEETLSPSEEAELITALDSDEERRARWIEDVRLDGWLKGMMGSTRDEETFQLRFQDCLAAQRDESRFIRKVRESMPIGEEKPRSTRRRAGRRPRLAPASDGIVRLLIPALVAAGMIFSILWFAAKPREVAREVVNRPSRIPAIPPSPSVPGPRNPEGPSPQPAPAIPSVAPKGKPVVTERPRDGRPAPPTNPPLPPSPPPRIAAPPPPAPPPKTVPSQAAVAVIEDVAGGVEMMHAGKTVSVREGTPVLSGATVKTSEPAGGATVRFPDGTVLTLSAGTHIDSLLSPSMGPGGKSLRLTRGSLAANVARQPAGRPMIFTLPNAAATVLGTTLRLSVETDRSRLEVTEGRVRIKRTSDGRTVDVPAGYQAVVAPGVSFRREPLEAPVFRETFTTLPLNAWPEGWKVHRDSTELRSGFRVVPDRSRGGNRVLACPRNTGGSTQHAVIPLETYPHPVEFTFHLRLTGRRNTRAGIEIEDGEVLPSVEFDAQAGTLRIDWPRGRSVAEKPFRIPVDSWSIWNLRIDREGIHLSVNGRMELRANVPGFSRVTGASLISRGADTAEYDEVRVVRRLGRHR